MINLSFAKYGGYEVDATKYCFWIFTVLVRKKLNNALPSLISVELMETCLGFWLHPKEVQLDSQFYTQSQKGTFRANLEFKLFSILVPPGALQATMS